MPTKKDYLVHYMMTKRPEMVTNIAMAISFLTVYVRNHEIYFKTDPKFYDGVLLMGVVGYKKDHNKFQKTVELGVNKFGCKIEQISEEEYKNG